MPEQESKQAISLIEKALDAFSRRDVDAFVEVAHPRIEFYPQGTSALARGGQPYRGHEGIRAYFGDVSRVWTELRVIPQKHLTVGDHVLVTGRIYAHGADGLLIDSPAHWVWRVEEDKLVWGCGYTDEDEALEALESSTG